MKLFMNAYAKNTGGGGRGNAGAQANRNQAPIRAFRAPSRNTGNRTVTQAGATRNTGNRTAGRRPQ